MALTDKLSAIGAAIREKSGKTELLTLDEMPQEIADLKSESGGDTTIEDAMVEKTLTVYENSRVTFLGNTAFMHQALLTRVSLPNVTKMGVRAFEDCVKLSDVNMPKLGTSVGMYAFSGCACLENISIPEVKDIASYAFRNCTALETCDFGGLYQIFGNAFINCSNLNKLILRTGQVVALANVNAFNGTPYGATGTGGVVYVPAALVEAYKTATNWSALYASGNCTFAAIEGSDFQ